MGKRDLIIARRQKQRKWPKRSRAVAYHMKFSKVSTCLIYSRFRLLRSIWSFPLGPGSRLLAGLWGLVTYPFSVGRGWWRWAIGVGPWRAVSPGGAREWSGQAWDWCLMFSRTLRTILKSWCNPDHLRQRLISYADTSFNKEVFWLSNVQRPYFPFFTVFKMVQFALPLLCMDLQKKLKFSATPQSFKINWFSLAFVLSSSKFFCIVRNYFLIWKWNVTFFLPELDRLERSLSL